MTTRTATPVTIKTDRLILRPWTDADLAPFAALNADPEVMRHLPGTLGRKAGDELAGLIRKHHRVYGYGLWAVELPGTARFIGYVGLSRPTFKSHFTPCVEVGWRLARKHHGNGFATEGARAALTFGFETLGLGEIVSFTVPANLASVRVMQKLGMQPAGEFDHPRFEPGHRLRRHVLYRITRETFIEVNE